jgi:hypothetical protein
MRTVTDLFVIRTGYLAYSVTWSELIFQLGRSVKEMCPDTSQPNICGYSTTEIILIRYHGTTLTESIFFN